MTVIRSHRKDSMVGTIGPQATKVDDADGAPWIAFRESAARASERPDLPRCISCGCESDRLPVHHSPRCTA